MSDAIDREKKFQNHFYPIVIAIMTIAIGVAVALYYCNIIALSWLFFIVIGTYLPLVCIHFIAKRFFNKEKKIIEKVNESAMMIISTFTCYFYMGFAIAIVDKNFQGIFACGIIIIIIETLMLIRSFLQVVEISSETDKPFNLFMLIRGLVSLGISIYLIYLIPNKYSGLQFIVATIIAAVYGGMITLIGVAWTIKSAEKHRKQDYDIAREEKRVEEINKAKPFFVCDILHSTIVENEIYTRILPYKEDEGDVILEAKFRNSDNANFYVKEIYFNGKWHFFYGNNTIIKNCTFRFDFNSKPVIQWDNTLGYLAVADILDNLYYYILHFQYGKRQDGKKFNTIYLCQEVSRNELPPFIWDEERKGDISKVIYEKLEE